MYMVISRWEVDPADREAFAASALVVREAARALPGAVDVNGFFSDSGHAVIVMSFESEEAYSGIYASVDSPFAKAIEEQRLDRLGKWLDSERGYLIR